MLTNSPEETFEPVSSALRRTWQFGKQQAPHAIFTAADGGCWRLAALFAFGAICAVALAARASDSVWEAASFGKVAAFPGCSLQLRLWAGSDSGQQRAIF